MTTQPARARGLAFAGALLLSTLVSHAQNKVLFIGNSFTQGSTTGGVPELFDRLARAGGQADPTTLMRAVGGVNYQYHSQSADTIAAVRSDQWTHVILQNYSTEPTHLVDGTHSISNHMTYGASLHQLILSNNPQTQVILFETWSRSAAHSLITGVSSPSGYASTTEFQTELRTNYQNLAAALSAAAPASPRVLVAPVGDAWQKAGGLRASTDSGFVSLHGSDNYHGNNSGYYLAAAVFYSLIYGTTPHGLSTNSLISSMNISFSTDPARLEDTAWSAVAGDPVAGRSLLFDFGSASQTTTLAAPPDDPTNYWNNVTDGVALSSTSVLTNFVTLLNEPTTVGLAMISRFNGANTAGTTASPLFAADATRDSLFGNTETFSGLANIFPSFKLTGLSPQAVYNLTFYACRAGVTDNREAGYTVTGANSGFTALNASNNTNQTATVSGILPTAAGEITIAIAPTANNNNGNHFTYLGVLKLDETVQTLPVVFTRQPASLQVEAWQPATFSAAVSGSAPYYPQWTSNGIPIPGATSLTYTLPVAATNMSGAVFALTVTNAISQAQSSNAVLTVVPQAPPGVVGGELLFDFGTSGAATSHGPAPQDPVYYWNNVTAEIGGVAGAQVANLVTADNTPTGIKLVIVSRFNAANENGALASTLYPSNAVRDSLFGNTESFNNITNIFPSFKLAGLHPETLFDFTFYASRDGISDNRSTLYTVTGATTATATLNAANNTTETVTVTGIAPSPAGDITISLSPAAANNNALHFTYLNVLKVRATPPQTPVAFTREPVSQRVLVFQPVTFSAAVTGAPPFFAQWFSNGVPIEGASQLSLTYSSVNAEMDGTLYSIQVSNLAFSATSSNAALRVITDTNPPVLLSLSCLDGWTIEMAFNERLDPAVAVEGLNYSVNDGSVEILSYVLKPDGRTVVLGLAAQISGAFTVTYGTMDLSGNIIGYGEVASGEVLPAELQPWLMDFGAAGSPTLLGPAPSDPLFYWNNVTDTIGNSPSGVLNNLVSIYNTPTPARLVMISRFTGANEGGPNNSPLYPANATRDSLYGNTELWVGLENVRPQFKLAGLDISLAYTLTFYAGRAGAADNRETLYTVTGATTSTAALNAANNLTNTVTVAAMRPDAAGEIAIGLAPGPNNNNPNHFTYLGVLKVELQRMAPRFRTPVLVSGQVILDWAGSGRLEWAASPAGPWTAVEPAPARPFAVDPAASPARFFRLAP